ncbi:MAG: lysylphosphatidylglycerol synthase transmembrane domain-containing protein [Planctomycetota bacterium]
MTSVSPEPETLSAAPMMDAGGAERAAPSGRKRVWFFIKLVVTVGLIGWILTQVDWVEFWNHLVSFQWWVIAVVMLIWALALSVSVVKWQQLLRVHGLHYPLGLLHRWYFISYFLSQFLPSIIGGDAFRIYKTLQNGKHRACAVLPVFVERASGLLALLMLGAVSAVIDWQATGREFSFWATVVSAAGAAAGVLGLVVVGGSRLDRRLVTWKRCPSALRSLHEHSADYFTHPRQIIIAAVISFVFHAMRVMVYWLFLFGLGYETSFFAVAVVTAATTVIGMLPISLGGYGLVDGSFMACMVFYGVPTEVGLTVMLMTRVTSLPVAVVGGVLYSLERSGDHGPAARAEAGRPEPRAAV